MSSVNIRINCFLVDGKLDSKAIGAGVYVVELKKSGRPNDSGIILYIGQSIYMVKRCGEHLHVLINKPEYFGLTKKILEDETLELCFRVLEYLPNSNPFSRMKQEIIWIKEKHPRTQSPNSDRQIKDKVKVVEKRIAELWGS